MVAWQCPGMRLNGCVAVAWCESEWLHGSRLLSGFELVSDFDCKHTAACHSVLNPLLWKKGMKLCKAGM